MISITIARPLVGGVMPGPLTAMVEPFDGDQDPDPIIDTLHRPSPRGFPDVDVPERGGRCRRDTTGQDQGPCSGVGVTAFTET